MRGIRRCEEKLSELVGPENLSATNNGIQGLKKLIGARTDIYANSELFLRDALKNKEFSSCIHNVGVLEDIPPYLYLHRRHREPVPKFAAVLKAIKKNEGLVEKYRMAVVNE